MTLFAMSGHSHAATIKRKKEATDAKKGTAFSKIARLITIAVKEGGGVTDPEKNPRLRLALEKAKKFNMPKENIQRAKNKGSGGGEGELQSAIYEGFGPAGAAFIVECITDSKNRTASEIKNLFAQSGGRLAEPGAAAHFFEKKGLIKVKAATELEKQILSLIDSGVEDVEEEKDFLNVYVPAQELVEFKTKIEKEKFIVESVEQVMKAKSKLVLDEQAKEKLKKFVDSLEERDDIQRIFVNVEI